MLKKEQIINKYTEYGICYPNRTLNIRSLPCITTGVILDQYYNGESVIYDYVVITDKYVWISWLSSSNRRVFMAIKDQLTGERFAVCDDIPIGSGGNQGDETITNEYPEDGICYPNRTINIRSLPCATTGVILDQYYDGESVIYDYVIITNKYVWISWISSSGKRVYMAIKDQVTGERFGFCTDIPGGDSNDSGEYEIRVKEYSESGICYPNRTLNIRSLPCATTGIILDQYYDGESVIYDYVIITNKYVWISWVSSGGKRVYMAVKDQVTGERFGLCTDTPSGGSNDSEGAPIPGVRKVFIDAGHGGNDPGAIGNSLKEKEIVLNIAKKLGSLLSNNGIEVEYSRLTDKYVDLAERSKQANDWGADLFVSIHTNAFDGNAYGTECYTHPNDTTVAKQLSSNVANTISSKLGLYNRGSKEADFAVLRLTNMPAILIETAFIDNSNEAKLLKDKDIDFAKAIYTAITGLSADSNDQINTEELFEGELFKKILDSSWLFKDMALDFTCNSGTAKSNEIITSIHPLITFHGEVSIAAKVLGGSTYIFGHNTSSNSMATSIMGKFIGSELSFNFNEKDIQKTIERIGISIPVGSYFKIKTEFIDMFTIEITAESQVDTSSLPDKFNDINVYSRLVFRIKNTSLYPKLYIPCYSEKAISPDKETGFNWGKIGIGEITTAALLAGVCVLAGLVTISTGGTGGVAISAIGVTVVNAAYSIP